MATAPDKANPPADEPSDEGILHDEYTDPGFVDPEPDAYDMPGAIESEGVLDDVADDADGIEVVDPQPDGAEMDTSDTGARGQSTDDSGDTGIGGDANSADALSEATIGYALPDSRGIARDDDEHREPLLDSRK